MICRFTITRVPEGFAVDEASLLYPPGSGTHCSLENARQSIETAAGIPIVWNHFPVAENGLERWETEFEIAEFTRPVNPRLKTDPEPVAAPPAASLPRRKKAVRELVQAEVSEGLYDRAPVAPADDYEDWV